MIEARRLYILEFLEPTAVGRRSAALRARAWRKLIRRAIHLHPHDEAFCDDRVEFLCNASTEAWRAPSDAPGGTVTCSLIVGNWEVHDVTADLA
jgi:hypothetical protein